MKPAVCDTLPSCTWTINSGHIHIGTSSSSLDMYMYTVYRIHYTYISLFASITTDCFSSQRNSSIFCHQTKTIQRSDNWQHFASKLLSILQQSISVFILYPRKQITHQNIYCASFRPFHIPFHTGWFWIEQQKTVFCATANWFHRFLSTVAENDLNSFFKVLWISQSHYDCDAINFDVQLMGHVRYDNLFFFVWSNFDNWA